MTISSPSGPTKIRRNLLILLNPVCPCGTQPHEKRINELADEVPHETTVPTTSAWLPLVLIASLPVWAWIVGGVV